MLTILRGARVTHANTCRSYGGGQVVEIIRAYVRPASKARVHFDGEPCPRLVWLDDLSPAADVAPAVNFSGLRLAEPGIYVDGIA